MTDEKIQKKGQSDMSDIPGDTREGKITHEEILKSMTK